MKPVVYISRRTGEVLRLRSSWKIAPDGVTAKFENREGRFQTLRIQDVLDSDFKKNECVLILLEEQWQKALVKSRVDDYLSPEVLVYEVLIAGESQTRKVAWRFEESEIVKINRYRGEIRVGIGKGGTIDVKLASSEEELIIWYETHSAFSDPSAALEIELLD